MEKRGQGGTVQFLCGHADLGSPNILCCKMAGLNQYPSWGGFEECYLHQNSFTNPTTSKAQLGEAPVFSYRTMFNWGGLGWTKVHITDSTEPFQIISYGAWDSRLDPVNKLNATINWMPPPATLTIEKTICIFGRGGLFSIIVANILQLIKLLALNGVIVTAHTGHHYYS